MFNISDINNEKIKYSRYTFHTLPDIDSVIYDLEGDTNGEVRRSDYINNKIIIHLNPLIDEYSIKYQKSILWHEFTHIFDLINNQKDEYMCTISEFKASFFEHRYLLSLKNNERLNNINVKIEFMNYKTTYIKILEYRYSLMKKYFTNTIKTRDNIFFNLAINNLMYFCGALKVIGNNKKTKEVVDKLAKQYPVFIEQ